MDRRKFLKYTAFTAVVSNTSAGEITTPYKKHVKENNNTAEFIIVNNYLLKKEDLDKFENQGFSL